MNFLWALMSIVLRVAEGENSGAATPPTNTNTNTNTNTTTTSGGVTNSDLNTIIGNINGVVSTALGILTAGVTILAIFIAYKFFTADTDDKRKNAKAQLIYAIIGVVVLLALLIFVPTVIETVAGSLGQ